ncbi:BrnT family toxin [Duganella callida]|uniref:BrnT family toxin n=1 Tax=Duganella callida TaxID=2561932 RepID=A0A4Y9S9F3_9BURK|nr:BrnT family toxin [Duganella callida]TFW18322.1 BrnT family toxin [Duganella callida]
MRFTWDPRKAKANLRKHGVSFEEAITVFDDGNAEVEFDASHSANEDRYFIRGHSEKARRLLVCHCYRDGGTVRMISARKTSY